MKVANVLVNTSSLVLSLLVGFSVFVTSTAQADPITPQVQTKIDKYKKQLVVWAANPEIIAAAKESNIKDGVPGMSNGKWDDVDNNDPVLAGLKQSAAGKLLSKWEENKELDKLFVRDEKGNLAAYSSGSGKPILYNNANRPPFQNGFKGVWSAKEVKPDPTTQKKTVQISVPVLEGGKAIGVLQSAVVAE